MLTLYYRGVDGEHYGIPPEKEIITDIEEEFTKIKLSGTAEEKEAIRIIDKGTFLDGYRFIDRFGNTLYKEELSTGCKGVIVLLHNPNKILDTKEVGLNARDVLVSLCKNGGAIITNVAYTRKFDPKHYKLGDSIDVEFGGNIFKSFDDLNYFIETGWYDNTTVKPKNKNK